MRFVHQGLGRGAIVAGVTGLASGTSNRGKDLGFQIESSDDVIGKLAKIEHSVWANFQAERLAQSPQNRRSAIAGVLVDPLSCNRPDFRSKNH